MSENAVTKLSEHLQAISHEIDDRIFNLVGERVAFSLFVWSNPRCSYISTADRAVVIEILESMIAHWKEGMPDIPAHQIS